jgi:protein arginine kinase
LSSRSRAGNRRRAGRLNNASPEQRREILLIARDVLIDGPVPERMQWIDLAPAGEHERRLLVERHLISRTLADADIERAVALTDDERLSVMVNEEDHLRMQRLAAGLCLDDVFEKVNALDDAVEQRVDYAFSKRWGYLTACPTNVGSGIRFSVMMHLPALRITNEIERVRRAAQGMHLAVRGYYGEGTEATGDFYQISNQVTLGRSERELLGDLRDRILPSIMEYERQARRVLVERNDMLLEDRTRRSLAVLREARLLSVEEAMKLLSRIRLAVHLGRLPELDPEVVNQLFLQVQPAHLVRSCGHLGGEEMRAARATLVRETLSAGLA